MARELREDLEPWSFPKWFSLHWPLVLSYVVVSFSLIFWPYQGSLQLVVKWDSLAPALRVIMSPRTIIKQRESSAFSETAYKIQAPRQESNDMLGSQESNWTDAHGRGNWYFGLYT